MLTKGQRGADLLIRAGHDDALAAVRGRLDAILGEDGPLLRGMTGIPSALPPPPPSLLARQLQGRARLLLDWPAAHGDEGETAAAGAKAAQLRRARREADRELGAAAAAAEDFPQLPPSEDESSEDEDFEQARGPWCAIPSVPFPFLSSSSSSPLLPFPAPALLAPPGGTGGC